MSKFTAWHKRAACIGEASDKFFGEPDAEGYGPGWDTAAKLAEGIAICERCPVRTPCLEYAITHRIRYGIWGGTTQTERRVLIRQRRRRGVPA